MSYRTVATLKIVDARDLFCEGCGMCVADGLIENVKLVVEIGNEASGAQLLCDDCRKENEP